VNPKRIQTFYKSKTSGGNLSNLARFLSDTKYADEFKIGHINSLWHIMIEIQRTINGLSPNFQDAIRYVGHSTLFQNITYSENLKMLPFKLLKKELSYLKNHLDKAMADFGWNRKGLKTGLVSKNLTNFKTDRRGFTAFDKTGLSTTDPKYPVIEHFYTLGQVGTWIMIWDCLIERWKIEFDKNGLPENIIGLDYINQIYPTFHLTTWTTKEENDRLKKIVDKIIKEYTNTEGIVSWDLIREDLKDARHYMEAGIVFHTEDIQIGKTLPIHPALVTQSLRDLKGKKTKIKQTHSYW
jgi:hypothetical protein